MVAVRRVFDDEDTIETAPPDTIPAEGQPDNELFEAVEWLKKAGVVSSERPAFSAFFDELVASSNDD